MKEYFSLMDMPIDEDGVVEYAITKFTEKKNELLNLKNSQLSMYAINFVLQYSYGYII